MSIEFQQNAPKNRLLAPELNDSDLEQQVDELIAKFPEENQDRIAQRIKNEPLESQIAILQNDLKRRNETLRVPKYESENFIPIQRVSDSLFEKYAKDVQNQAEVGKGNNGRVFEYPTDEEGQTAVFKMLIRVPMDYQNDLMSEGAYQVDVANIAKNHPELRIGVPEVYYVAQSNIGLILSMQKVPGHSVRDIQEKKIKLPENFDYADLQKRLNSFVEVMNTSGFYHRDLNEGNIMIDPHPVSESAPIAYIIDYGLCKKAISRDAAYGTLDGTKDHVMINTAVEQLRSHQTLVAFGEE